MSTAPVRTVHPPMAASLINPAGKRRWPGATTQIWCDAFSALAAASMALSSSREVDPLEPPQLLSTRINAWLPPRGSPGSAPEFHHGPPRRRDTIARRNPAALARSSGLSQPLLARSRSGPRMSIGDRGPVIVRAVTLRIGVATPHPGGARNRPGPNSRKGTPSAAARLLAPRL